MITYLLVSLIIILFGIFSDRIERKYTVVALFLVLLVVLGFRGGFTQDYRGYSQYFLYIKALPLKYVLSHGFSMEKGFVLLTKIIGFVTASPMWYHFILSAILLAFYFNGFKNASSLWLTILLFVNLGDYYGSMNLFRQALVGAIVFNGYRFLAKKEYVKYAIIIAVAILIHSSAIIMIPVSFILLGKINMKTVLKYIIGTVIAFFVLPYLIDIITGILPKYKNYHYGMGAGSVNASIPMLVIIAFCMYSLRFEPNSFDLNLPENRILFNGMMLAGVALLLGTKVYMLTRMVYFFRPCACVLLPKVLSSYSNKKDRLIFTILICITMLAFTQVTLSGTGYDPYYFIWQKG